MKTDLIFHNFKGTIQSLLMNRIFIRYSCIVLTISGMFLAIYLWKTLILAVKVAQWALSIKLDNLSLNFEIHMVEGDN